MSMKNKKTQSSPAPSAGRPESPGQPVGAQLQGPALNESLKRQLEWYFSEQNLSRDTYLTSKMDEQKYVPISVIASFPKVKAMTEDQGLLVEVMKTCMNISVDETGSKCKPIKHKKAQRRTLVLKQMGKDTTMDDIKTFFQGDHCKGKVTEVKAEVGNSWFVSFETEQECLSTAQ